MPKRKACLKVVVSLLFITMFCGCRTTSLSSVETEFEVGVVGLEMMRTVAVYGGMLAGWNVEQAIEDGVRLSYTAGKHSLKCDVLCVTGQFKIKVVTASSSLLFDPYRRKLHKKAIGWVLNLKNAIVVASERALSPFEVSPPIALSVANGNDLKIVITSVCKAHNMEVKDLSEGVLLATFGQGPERCQLKITYEKMLFSIRHDRPEGAQTNGFQYDFLIRDIKADIIRLSDPKLSEMKRRTDLEHLDRRQMSLQYERLIYAVRDVGNQIDRMNSTIKYHR